MISIPKPIQSTAVLGYVISFQQFSFKYKVNLIPVIFMNLIPVIFMAVWQILGFCYWDSIKNNWKIPFLQPSPEVDGATEIRQQSIFNLHIIWKDVYQLTSWYINSTLLLNQ